jgi:enoyl-CoA hydratase/carnithine racemase
LCAAVSKYLGQFPKPIVAAVNGYVLGGGCELMMLCDIAIAAEGTKFGQPEITIGSIPGDGGGTQRLPRFVGKSMAMHMVLTGQLFTAQQMRDAGLVSEVLPEDALLERAVALAQQIAGSFSFEGPAHSLSCFIFRYSEFRNISSTGDKPALRLRFIQKDSEY